VYAFGTGLVAIILLLAGISAMLPEHDRKQLFHLLRHPIQVIFSEPDQPDRD
jgi:hypothetical protein